MKRKLLIILLGSAICLTPCTARAAEYEGSNEAVKSYLEYEEYLNSIPGICEEIGLEYGISPELLQAIIERESSGIPTAQNGECKGLMQVSERWHKDRMERLGVTDLYDSYSNVLTAADYLSELKGLADGDIIYALLRYSLKTETADRLYESGQTTPYVRGVLARAAELEEIHEVKNAEDEGTD